MKNLPNKITIVRICLLPLIIFFYLAEFIGPWSKFVAFALFLIACLTDMLVGYIARKYDLVTDFGKFLDPIADKLLATTGLVLLITGENPIFPTIIGIIFMFIMIQRDYVVTGLRQLGQLKGVIIQADKVAKIKANFLYFTLNAGMFLAFLFELGGLTSDFIEIARYVIYGFATLTCCLIVLSEIVYLMNNAKVFKNDVPHIEAVDNEQEQCINFKNE